MCTRTKTQKANIKAVDVNMPAIQGYLCGAVIFPLTIRPLPFWFDSPHAKHENLLDFLARKDQDDNKPQSLRTLAETRQINEANTKQKCISLD